MQTKLNFLNGDNISFDFCVTCIITLTMKVVFNIVYDVVYNSTI